MLGRSPLDEDAIRTIEDSHPDIDFDWPAILALSEVMTPEDETPVRREKKKQPRPPREQSPREQQSREPREVRDEDAPAATIAEESPAQGDYAATSEPDEVLPLRSLSDGGFEQEPSAPAAASHGNRLLEELVGREIATRLRARYAEIMTRIHEQDGEGAQREAWAKRAEPLNPDLWVTPAAILDGVRAADSLYDSLKSQLS